MIKNNSFNSTRFFNSISVVDNGKNVKKKSIYLSKFKDEINWFINLPKSLTKFIPKVNNYSLKPTMFIKYENIAVPTIHFFYVNGENINWSIVRKLYSSLLSNFHSFKPRTFNRTYWHDALIDIYLAKTITRLLKISLDNRFLPFFKSRTVRINNKLYPSANTIKNYLYLELKKMLNNQDINPILLDICTPRKNNICLFHGDLCFSNVFIDTHKKSIKCIDPRGSFASDKMYGDILFDYAKITQSALGLYDLVIEDKFKLTYDHKNIQYKIFLPSNYSVIQTEFTKFIPQKYKKQIRLIESLQFLSMIPWHNDKPQRQIVFLCIGIKLFCEYIGEDKWWK